MPIAPDNSNAEFAQRLRAESVLDRRIRLAIPRAARAESGPSAVAFYLRRKRLGIVGEFEGLHPDLSPKRRD